ALDTHPRTSGHSQRCAVVRLDPGFDPLEPEVLEPVRDGSPHRRRRDPAATPGRERRPRQLAAAVPELTDLDGTGQLAVLLHREGDDAPVEGVLLAPAPHHARVELRPDRI